MGHIRLFNSPSSACDLRLMVVYDSLTYFLIFYQVVVLCSVLNGTNNIGSLLGLKFKRGSLMSSSNARIFGLKRVQWGPGSSALRCLLTSIKPPCLSGWFSDQRGLSTVIVKGQSQVNIKTDWGLSMWAFYQTTSGFLVGSQYRTGLSLVFKMPVCSESIAI